MDDCCMWCESKAEFACDAAIGMKATLCPGSGREPGPRIVYEGMSNAEVYRCDAPICSEHRHHVGNMFICGGPNASGETVDHCPYCVDRPREPAPMLKEDADRIRRLRHAEIRRSQLRLSVSAGAEPDGG